MLLTLAVSTNAVWGGKFFKRLFGKISKEGAKKKTIYIEISADAYAQYQELILVLGKYRMASIMLSKPGAKDDLDETIPKIMLDTSKKEEEKDEVASYKAYKRKTIEVGDDRVLRFECQKEIDILFDTIKGLKQQITKLKDELARTKSNSTTKAPVARRTSKSSDAAAATLAKQAKRIETLQTENTRLSGEIEQYQQSFVTIATPLKKLEGGCKNTENARKFAQWCADSLLKKLRQIP